MKRTKNQWQPISKQLTPGRGGTKIRQGTALAMYRGGLQGPPRLARLDRKIIIFRDPAVAVGAHVKVNKLELRPVGGDYYHRRSGFGIRIIAA